MQVSVVFPMFWGRKKKKIYKKGDQFYDHPTALDDQGTIPPLFDSQAISDYNSLTKCSLKNYSLLEA